MSELYKHIAELLYSYEVDEPHDEELEEDQYYGKVSWEQIAIWSEMEHHGDCVCSSNSCMKCEADHLIHKAKWMAKKLEK